MSSKRNSLPRATMHVSTLSKNGEHWLIDWQKRPQWNKENWLKLHHVEPLTLKEAIISLAHFYDNDIGAIHRSLEWVRPFISNSEELNTWSEAWLDTLEVSQNISNTISNAIFREYATEISWKSPSKYPLIEQIWKCSTNQQQWLAWVKPSLNLQSKKDKRVHNVQSLHRLPPDISSYTVGSYEACMSLIDNANGDIKPLMEMSKKASFHLLSTIAHIPQDSNLFKKVSPLLKTMIRPIPPQTILERYSFSDWFSMVGILNLDPSEIGPSAHQFNTQPLWHLSIPPQWKVTEQASDLYRQLDYIITLMNDTRHPKEHDDDEYSYREDVGAMLRSNAEWSRWIKNSIEHLQPELTKEQRTGLFKVYAHLIYNTHTPSDNRYNYSSSYTRKNRWDTTSPVRDAALFLFPESTETITMFDSVLELTGHQPREIKQNYYGDSILTYTSNSFKADYELYLNNIQTAHIKTIELDTSIFDDMSSGL